LGLQDSFSKTYHHKKLPIHVQLAFLIVFCSLPRFIQYLPFTPDLVIRCGSRLQKMARGNFAAEIAFLALLTPTLELIETAN